MSKKTKNVAISISGGAIKLIALITSFIELLNNNVRPKCGVGVSAGSIIWFLFACRRLDEGLELARKSHDIRIIFSLLRSPITRKGGISFWALFRQLGGKPYLGKFDNLEKNIRSICSEKDYNTNYLHNNDSIPIYICFVEKETRKSRIVNLQNVSYDQAISIVMASASAYPTVAPVKIFDGSRYILGIDGGHKEHSAGSLLLEKEYNTSETLNLTELITIWSRDSPGKYLGEYIKDNDKNFINALESTTIRASLEETSVNDEYKEKELCENLGIDYYPIYIRKFTDESFVITKSQIKLAEEIAKKATYNYYLKYQTIK